MSQCSSLASRATLAALSISITDCEGGWLRFAGRQLCSRHARQRSPECLRVAQKFQRLVDALNDAGETSYTHTDRDVLRQHEIWPKTGSLRAYGILRSSASSPPVPVVAQRTDAPTLVR
jgi:hypothetical protein